MVQHISHRISEQLNIVRKTQASPQLPWTLSFLLHLLNMKGQAGVYDLACTWVLNSGNFSAREQEVQTTYCITEEYLAKKNWDYSLNKTFYWKCYFIWLHKTSIKASQTDASGLLLQNILSEYHLKLATALHGSNLYFHMVTTHFFHRILTPNSLSDLAH